MMQLGLRKETYYDWDEVAIRNGKDRCGEWFGLMAPCDQEQRYRTMAMIVILLHESDPVPGNATTGHF